jgi:hypothetical protein
MAILGTEWSVEMADGTIFKCVSDQRDLARYEVQDGMDGPHTRARFLAWSSLVRQQDYAGPFKQFNETDCVEVVVLGSDQQDSEDEKGLDPGQATTPATPSSTSPRPAGKRSQARRGSKAGTPATSTP